MHPSVNKAFRKPPLHDHSIVDEVLGLLGFRLKKGRMVTERKLVSSEAELKDLQMLVKVFRSASTIVHIHFDCVIVQTC